MATLQKFLTPAFYVGLADKWLVPLLVTLLVGLSLALAKRLALRRVRAWAERSRPRFDDVVIVALERTRPYFILALALWAGSEYVELSVKSARWLRALISLLVIFQVGVWLNVAIQRATEKWAGQNTDGRARTMATGLAFVAKLCVGAVLFVMALSSLGFEVSALIAGLGVGGVAAALAVQSLLGDLLASLAIFFDRPFDLGDSIAVGPEKGTVERIGLRSTRIRALDGHEIVFANGDLIKSRIYNYKRMQERRVVFTLVVDHDASGAELTALPDVIRGIIEPRPGLRFERAHFSQILASGFEFEVAYFVLSPDYNAHMDHRQAINLAVLEHLRGAVATLARSLPGALPAAPSLPAAPAGGGKPSAPRQG